jgi:hypothetical protein
LTLPVAFDRVLTYAVGASMQVKVASLNGSGEGWNVKFQGKAV